jgi:S1-C subfamily serine protease
MRKLNVFTTIIVFVVGIIIIPLSTFIVQPTVIAAQQQSQNTNSSSSQNTNSSSSQNTNSSSTSSPLKAIFKNVENSIVQITSKIPTGAPNPLNPQSENATTLGSGFVYDKQGHIVTNGHVVGDARIVDVTFVDGNRYTAKVVASDIYSDIAVIQISQNVTQQQLLSSLKPLVIGNSSELEVGDQVIAIGDPFGLSDTMTTGIVSGLGRLLPAAGAGFSIPNIIQTDAPINPGNSGGPLLNLQGEVIGMNTAIFSGTGTFSGIGFAIPSNTMTRIVPTLIEKGYYVHPYLGIKGGSLTSDLAENLTGIPLATHLSGILVDTITKDGPADKAGVHGSTTDQYSKKHVGDLIIAVDVHKVVRIDDLGSYIDQHKSVGDNITLTVYRNGHLIDLKTTLTARPSPLPSLIARSAHPSPTPQPP